MSYILDALKRADAERERGHVPGLHTRTTPSIDAPATQTGGWAQHARLMALGMLVLVLLGAALWWWLRAAQPAAPAVSAAAPTTTARLAPAVAPAPLPLPAAALPTPASPEPADNASRVVSQPTPPVLPILSPPPPPAPVKAAASPPAVAATNAQVTPKPPANAISTQKNATATAPVGATVATTNPTAATVTVPSFAELSPETRARLPAVNVSGSTYSKNPTLRMLIVNGKVVQEGDEIGPGLALETIEPRSAVLNHQGLRYRIGY